jgi:hypothetical protein
VRRWHGVVCTARKGWYWTMSVAGDRSRLIFRLTVARCPFPYLPFRPILTSTPNLNTADNPLFRFILV